MINRLTLLVCTLGLLTGCNNAKKSTVAKTENDSADGWTLLFDGKTTAGWHSYGNNKATARWNITEGVLNLDTSKRNAPQKRIEGDLVTDKEYGNFHLKMEWKISLKGNSGIIFYVHEDTAKYKNTYNTGLEMQVLDNDGHPDGKIIKHRSGDLYDLISCSTETVKPVGEWNEAEIFSKDGQLDLFLNGTKVVSTILWDDNWKKLVAGSKFKTMPDFGTYKKGRIALQDHGNVVMYRNIKIKEL